MPADVVRAKVGHFIESGRPITGVVHVGANDGEEVPYYLEHGNGHVLCFEPIPEACDRFWEQHGNYYPDVRCLNIALGEVDENIEFFVHAGDGKDSSRYHQMDNLPWQMQPEVEAIQVVCMRFDTIAPDIDSTIGLHLFNTLVVDSQGMELEVLRGFGDYLKCFDYLNIECSHTPVYKGEATAAEVVAYLEAQGYRAETPITVHDDIMFSKIDA